MVLGEERLQGRREERLAVVRRQADRHVGRARHRPSLDLGPRPSGIMAPMKVVILAGGVGSRLAEETEVRPKPMIEIGGRPILWHIMKHYAHFGFDDFTVALGYKGEYIKRYFTDYAHLEKNLTISLSRGHVEWLESGHQDPENWT